jgi:hypothetical protein
LYFCSGHKNLPHSHAAREITKEIIKANVIADENKKIGMKQANKTLAVMKRVLSIFNDDVL